MRRQRVRSRSERPGLKSSSTRGARTAPAAHLSSLPPPAARLTAICSLSSLCAAAGCAKREQEPGWYSTAAPDSMPSMRSASARCSSRAARVVSACSRSSCSTASLAARACAAAGGERRSGTAASAAQRHAAAHLAEPLLDGAKAQRLALVVRERLGAHARGILAVSPPHDAGLLQRLEGVARCSADYQRASSNDVWPGGGAVRGPLQ